MLQELASEVFELLRKEDKYAAEYEVARQNRKLYVKTYVSKWADECNGRYMLLVCMYVCILLLYYWYGIFV